MAKSSALRLVRPSSFRPIVIRAPSPIKHVKTHKKKHHGSSHRGLMHKERMGIVAGGFAVGLIQKQGIPLPKLPFLGEAGTIGVAAYFLSDNGKNRLADEICTAALSIAAYELGATGTIVGAGEPDFGQQPGNIGYVAGF